MAQDHSTSLNQLEHFRAGASTDSSGSTSFFCGGPICGPHNLQQHSHCCGCPTRTGVALSNDAGSKSRALVPRDQHTLERKIIGCQQSTRMKPFWGFGSSLLAVHCRISDCTLSCLPSDLEWIHARIFPKLFLQNVEIYVISVLPNSQPCLPKPLWFKCALSTQRAALLLLEPRCFLSRAAF